MLGTLVNTGAILLGGSMGLLLRKGLPEKYTDAIMKGLALCVIYLGVDGALEGANPLIPILATVTGGVLGTLLDLDGRMTGLGDYLETTLKKGGGGFSTGFVTASLLFCVGAMAVVGSLQSGLTGDHTMLYTKSLLDLIGSAVLAATLGAGVLFSALSILLFQGGITLLAETLAPVLSQAVVAEMTCVGSIYILGIGLNMLGCAKLKIINYVPGIFLAIPLCYLLA